MACAVVKASSHNGEVLRIIDSVPVRHGVVAATGRDDCGLVRQGEVLVYDELDREPTEAGIFVLEFQTPVGGMSWATMRRLESERVKVAREVCRLFHRRGSWWAHPLRSRASSLAGLPLYHMADGPYDEAHIGDRIIGRVVGLYRAAEGR